LTQKSRRVHIKSFGCSANLADGEVIAGCLSNAGFEITENPDYAEFLVYNTCAVKSQTENRIVDILKKAPRDKMLIVTGCLPVISFERIKNEVDFDGATGPAPGEKIVDVLCRVAAGERVVSIDVNSDSGLDLPRVPTNPVVSIVPINYGCLGKCSYCCVHLARGKLRSNSVEDVLGRVKEDLGAGVKEFWLTSQDTACYGKDVGTNLTQLLQSICGIEGDFFARVGMMNPDHVLGMLDELIEAYKCNKVFKFLHLPVQSGDNRVLELMNRHYTVDEFVRVVEAFRAKIPQLTLSTDVICGFPRETNEAFERTMSLVSEVEPDIVNVSKFFARPGTAAENLIPVAPKELNRRSRQLSKLSRKISFEKNKAWLEWKGPVLFDEQGKEGSWMGRNFAYKPVVVKTDDYLLGQFVSVRVTSAFSTYLEAKIL
jgi:MiaB-like tRNA modifying enzyme